MKEIDTIEAGKESGAPCLTLLPHKNCCQGNAKIVVGQAFDIKKDRNNKKVYLESYGCQMNFSDSEIVASILAKAGFEPTLHIEEADVILLNTCAIRDKAEQTIYNRLLGLKPLKEKKEDLLIGVLGCMAKRLKEKLLEEERMLDIIAGPDSYRDLPRLLACARQGHQAVNTFLSREETYADISPVRLQANGVTAFISIMRGCDNMCSFCVVPFTRGRERSRNPYSIVAEATDLFQRGYREVTLLGQNVDSYKWSKAENSKIRLNKKGISEFVSFAELLERVAQIHPGLRVRFSTSHPRDITDQVLYTMARYNNICNHIHLPVQSGNESVLQRMSRGYTRDWYIEKVKRIREVVGPEVGLSSDIIAGFCGETETEHQDTLSLMDEVEYDFSYMFCYSERPGTVAAKKLRDNVPEAVKKERLRSIIDKQTKLSLARNRLCIGKVFNVLVEGPSKRSDRDWQGRNSANKVAIFPKCAVTKGQYVNIRVEDCTAATLLGKIID